jgi:DNA-binding transcriptional LysR family regulator
MVTKKTELRRSHLANLATSRLIDSKRLLYFYHVARTGSFSAAETVLDVAQPAITRQVQQLESELGVQLLERDGRGVSPTQFGNILYKQAERLLGQMSDTFDAIRKAKSNPAGSIKIAASAGFMANHMPEILNQFIKAYPDVQITAIQAPTGEVYDRLSSGDVDIAIISQPPNSRKVTRQKLVTESMYLIVARNHPLAREKVVGREQLQELQLVLPASEHGIRLNIEKYFASAEMELTTHLRVDSVPLIQALVSQGRFCTILPAIAVSERDAANLVMIPLRPAATRTLWVASLSDRTRQPFVKAMMHQIVSAFEVQSK